MFLKSDKLTYKVMNPSGWEVLVGAGGVFDTIAPFTEVECTEKEIAEHLSRSNERHGIVMIEYKAGMTKEEEEELRTRKEIEGLKNLLNFREEVLYNEKQAQKEMATKQGAEIDKRYLRIDEFEENVKLVKDWLKDVMGEMPVSMKPKAKVVKKKPTLKAKGNESTTAKN